MNIAMFVSLAVHAKLLIDIKAKKPGTVYNDDLTLNSYTKAFNKIATLDIMAKY